VLTEINDVGLPYAGLLVSIGLLSAKVWRPWYGTDGYRVLSYFWIFFMDLSIDYSFYLFFGFWRGHFFLIYLSLGIYCEGRDGI